MGDPRIQTLKHLINSFHFLEQFMNFSMQWLDSEVTELRQSTENWEISRIAFKSLGNLQDLQKLWNEYQRQKNKILSAIQKFLDFNQDLRGTKYYLEATDLIEKQKGQLDGGNQPLAAA